MATKEEIQKLLITMWSEGNTTEEMRLKLIDKFNLHLEQRTVAGRCKALVNKGILQPRETGWHHARQSKD